MELSINWVAPGDHCNAWIERRREWEDGHAPDYVAA
jgi:hypothetical protein